MTQPDLGRRRHPDVVANLRRCCPRIVETPTKGLPVSGSRFISARCRSLPHCLARPSKCGADLLPCPVLGSRNSHCFLFDRGEILLKGRDGLQYLDRVGIGASAQLLPAVPGGGDSHVNSVIRGSVPRQGSFTDPGGLGAGQRRSSTSHFPRMAWVT